MKQTRKNNSNRLWFGRWSRKSWAVFSSLRRVVHILRVKIDIVKQSLQKEGFFMDMPSSFTELITVEPEPDEKIMLMEFIVIQNSDICDACGHTYLFERKTAGLINFSGRQFFILKKSYTGEVQLFTKFNIMKQVKKLSVNLFRFKHFSRKPYSIFNSLKKIIGIGVVATYMLIFANQAKAQVDTVLHVEIPEVIVSGSRIDLPLSKVTKHLTIITRDEISRMPVQSIQDLLVYTAGIDVLQRSGHGVQADISVRGGSFDQTAILLNGINLSNPQTGHYSFDIPINLNDIERIEIIHGPSSLIYGASAFSGGINIITKKRGNHKLYGKLQSGDHKLFAFEAGTAINSGKTSNNFSFGYNKSDGFRENTDYDILNALWQTRLVADKAVIDFQTGYNNKKFGANSFYTPAYPFQYEETESYFASVKGEMGNKLKFLPSVYWSRHYDCFQLFRDGSPNTPEWYTNHNYHRTDVYGANINMQYSWIAGITSFGAELRNEGILSNVLGVEMQEPDGHYTKSYDRTNISYALEHMILLDKFSINAGLLANYNTALKKDYRFYPSVNVSYRPFRTLRTYASWSKATRMPTFTDLYYNTATHSGNAYLKPEYSESFELGVKYSEGIINAYLTGFLMSGDNLIDWMQGSPEEKWQSVNHASLTKRGFETGIHVDLRYMVLKVDYARLSQNGKNVSGQMNSNYVLNYLRDKFTVVMNLPVYKDIVVTNLSFRWQKRMGNYAKYDLETGTSALKSYPAFSTMDFRVDYKILRGLKININVNNLYDTHYWDLGNLPQAGRWISGGVSYLL